MEAETGYCLDTFCLISNESYNKPANVVADVPWLSVQNLVLKQRNHRSFFNVLTDPISLVE